MAYLTIFTPTYNRSNTLDNLYMSLKKQSCKDFIWLVIDDGSTDDTKEKVNQWISTEKEFEIDYYYKQNGGLHTAYNLAIEKMGNTELSMCVDSDDMVADDAVKKIINIWKEKCGDNIGGIVGLDFTINGELIGGYLPLLDCVDLVKLTFGGYNVTPGDKKIICRTDLYKNVAPLQGFPGEKYFNPSYLHNEIGLNYKFLVLNEPLCIVNYQQNGMTSNIFKQYKNSPNSFIELRKQSLRYADMRFIDIIKTIIHLDAESLLANKWLSEFEQSNFKLLMILCFPFGLILKQLILIKG